MQLHEGFCLEFVTSFVPLPDNYPKYDQNNMQNVSNNLSFFYQSKEFKRSSRQLNAGHKIRI